MGDVPSLSTPPPTSSPSKSNLPMMYYGLVVVGTAAIILAVYNLIIIKWCSEQHRRSRRPGMIRTLEPMSGRSLNRASTGWEWVSSFKYKKDQGGVGEDEDYYDDEYECPVCLSVFEEGEEVRKLPTCSHSFHAPCIDMWLYSHFDCPLCRAPVDPPNLLRRHLVPDQSENSPQGNSV